MGPSKPPTKLEREWMDRARAFGCVACWLDGSRRNAAIHHICQGYRRLGHLYTIPLCDPGHHKDGRSMGFISVHEAKRSFVARYGTELELLARLQVELGVYSKVVTA